MAKKKTVKTEPEPVKKELPTDWQIQCKQMIGYMIVKSAATGMAAAVKWDMDLEKELDDVISQTEPSGREYGFGGIHYWGTVYGKKWEVYVETGNA